MVSQKPTIRRAEVQLIAALTEIIAGRAVPKARIFAVAALLTALVLSTTARAATITVNSLADTGGSPNAANLLVNGDFSLGHMGFTSDYVFTNDTVPAGTYCINTDPHNCHPGGASYGDHTTGTGLMLNANGATTANQIVWQETVSVASGTQYIFSGWVASWGTNGGGVDPSPAELRFFINGVQVGQDFAAPTPNGLWSQFVAGWNSGTNTSATIAIVDLNLAANGNDFSLDDLSLQQSTGTCTLRDAITAANAKTITNGCAAGTGNDTINFSATGTITLGSSLPQITDSNLTINGPASPSIRIDGGGKVEVMVVGSSATVELNRLSIANGFIDFPNVGGAIFNDGTLTVTNSTFYGNSAGDGGGAIWNNGGKTLTVTNSTFSGNSSGAGGGAIYNNPNSGTQTVTNSTFSKNSAALGGAIFNGGLFHNAGILIVSNSTFSSNSAQIGGGIESQFGALTVTNSTFSGNTAIAGGGAINSGSGGANVKTTILAASGGGNCAGPMTDAGYNISDDSSCNFSATGSLNNTDPMLSGLANNGGPTKTVALQSGSPAIDAIPLPSCTDQASPPNPNIIDQRLFPRPDAGESKCDIGAFEVQDRAFVPFPSFNGSVRIDPDAGVFALLGGFTVRNSVTINPITQPVALGIGSYAIRLPAGSFTRFSNGYVYKKTVNGISLRINIQFTRFPFAYTFQAYRSGGTIDSSTSPLPATLTIGNNIGTKQMKATYY